MAETIHVDDPRDLVPIVLARWDGVTAEQLGELAAQVWGLGYDEKRGFGNQTEADLLNALQELKKVDACTTFEQLQEAWERVEGGTPNTRQNYGGLCVCEGESRNFAKARKFIEGQFIPRIVAVLDREFDRL